MGNPDQPRLLQAAKYLQKLRKSEDCLAPMKIAEIQGIDLLFCYAESCLCKNEFQNYDLHEMFFSNLEPRITSSDEAERWFYAAKRLVHTAAFNYKASSISDLAEKAKIWRRSICEDHTKTPAGFPEEFLSWSLFKDITRLSNTPERAEFMPLNNLSAST